MLRVDFLARLLEARGIPIQGMVPVCRPELEMMQTTTVLAKTDHPLDQKQKRPGTAPCLCMPLSWDSR